MRAETKWQLKVPGNGGCEATLFTTYSVYLRALLVRKSEVIFPDRFRRKLRGGRSRKDRADERGRHQVETRR